TSSAILPLPILAYLLRPTHPTQISTLSLHDALPISQSGSEEEHHEQLSEDRRSSGEQGGVPPRPPLPNGAERKPSPPRTKLRRRSEEHTSELQSRENLVCRLLLEKKKHRQ